MEGIDQIDSICQEASSPDAQLVFNLSPMLNYDKGYSDLLIIERAKT